MSIINQINSELTRLRVGVDNNPYSGLMAEEDQGRVRVFDDHMDVVIENPEALLKRLRSLPNQGVSLENIWFFLG